MYKVVPAPDDPEMFIVQSDPMPRDEADAAADRCNAAAEETEMGEEGMPPFMGGMEGGPGGEGGMPPMPPMPPRR